MQTMTLQDIITKITEAEASISKELEKDNLDLAQEYIAYTHKLLQELIRIKPQLSKEELDTAQEFAKAYADHIKGQLEVLSTEKNKVENEYRQVKKKHSVSNKYAKIKKMMSAF